MEEEKKIEEKKIEEEKIEEKKIEEKKIEEEKIKEKLTPTLDLFESSVRIWWKNIIKFILVVVWGFVYALIPLAVVLLLMFRQGDRNSFSWSIAAFLIFLVGLLAIYYFMIRGYIGSFLLIKKNYEGKPLEIFKETKSLAVPCIGLSILTAVLVLLWSLLLIIPGIIYSVFYSLALYVFFFEDKRGMAALRRSKELVKGYFWPVFGRICFLTLVMWVFGMVISIPSSMSPEQSAARYIWNGIAQLFNFLIAPISLLYSYQIYQDLVKIKK